MKLPSRSIMFLAASAMTASSGVAAMAVGGTQMKAANQQIKLQAGRYSDRHLEHEIVVAEATDALQSLGEAQTLALHDVIFRMRDFLKRHAKQVRAHEHLILDGVHSADTPVIGLTKLDPDVSTWVQGVVNTGIVGMVTPVFLKTAVTKLAVASSGTSISSLSGAAAAKATLAWFGGGAISAGGGGIALGTTVLNAAVAGPSLLVVGVTVKNRGTKARTEAEAHRTQVEICISHLDVRDEELRAIRLRSVEIETILRRLISAATDSLEILESKPFDLDLHAEQLQQALILVKAVRDVATAPIIDEDENLDPASEAIALKYQHYEGVPVG